jgi:hypothetical protein
MLWGATGVKATGKYVYEIKPIIDVKNRNDKEKFYSDKERRKM